MHTLCELLQLSHGCPDAPRNLSSLPGELRLPRLSIAVCIALLRIIEQPLGAGLRVLTALRLVDDKVELSRPVVYRERHLGGCDVLGRQRVETYNR